MQYHVLTNTAAESIYPRVCIVWQGSRGSTPTESGSGGILWTYSAHPACLEKSIQTAEHSNGMPNVYVSAADAHAMPLTYRSLPSFYRLPHLTNSIFLSSVVHSMSMCARLPHVHPSFDLRNTIVIYIITASG